MGTMRIVQREFQTPHQHSGSLLSKCDFWTPLPIRDPSEKILHLDKVLQTYIIYAFSKIFTILVNQQVRPLKPRKQCTITAMIVCVVTMASLGWVPNSGQTNFGIWWKLFIIKYLTIRDWNCNCQKISHLALSSLTIILLLHISVPSYHIISYFTS